MKAEKTIIGIVAHVDAGKTTLAESLLYQTGQTRRLGRVDHQDAFLDTYELERSRGITIFSKQAQISLPGKELTLLDTPGHVDFSAEMERTLQVLDYAILVISGADGVQGHTQTLWRLLKQYRVPAFLFINKMDQEGTNREALLSELKSRLDERMVDFTLAGTAEWEEQLAMTEDSLLEQYLETGRLEMEQLQRQIAKRELFPCYFGSALKLHGISEFVSGLQQYLLEKQYPEEFAARVFKIARDPQGNRLTYLKVTGGVLRAKQVLKGQLQARAAARSEQEQREWEEKTGQLRLYSGASCTQLSEAGPGVVCCVTGLSHTYAGEGLGLEEGETEPLLAPVLTYQLLLPEGCEVHRLYRQLLQLEEEIPELHLVWQEELQEIHVQVMGEIQIEIIRSMIRERFGIEVQFASGSIIYKETIARPVEGVGHFEPLRHYAEVHLLLEPGERGSGLVFDTACSVDVLNKNWQRLVLTHLEEREHRGVLTGSAITDLKITLVSGRSHPKHTEGGDFREATYRAVRQGLMQAESVLLEPVYQFRLELPAECVGRAMADLQTRSGSFSLPVPEGELTVLTGSAPVSSLQGYQQEVAAYSRGRGHLICTLKGYEPCHQAQEVIAARAYVPEADLEQTPDSVFCAHGAGFVVPWHQVTQYMHLPALESLPGLAEESIGETERTAQAVGNEPEHWVSLAAYEAEKEELDAIFERTYGPVKKRYQETEEEWQARRQAAPKKPKPYRGSPVEEECLLVDGYNIIFSWEDLNALAQESLAAARRRLMDLLSNYQGYANCHLILVFDAYQVEKNPGSISKYHNIYVVYTKEAETADQYIEKTVPEMDKKYRVTVATSDALEQVIILAKGAIRMSASGLRDAVNRAEREIHGIVEAQKESGRVYLFHEVSDQVAEQLEQVRIHGGKEDALHEPQS